MSRQRKRDSTGLRRLVEQRANGRCEYCHSPQRVCGYRFHLEHVIPVCQQGTDDEGNRALACAACKLAKPDRTSAIDPEFRAEVPLFNPRSDMWFDHFVWNKKQGTIRGRAAAGRATIEALGLNDEFRRSARELWFHAGLLP